MGNSFIEDWTHYCYLSGRGFGCQLERSSPSIVALSGLVVRVTCFNKSGANIVQLVRALSALCVTLLLNTLNRTADVKVVPQGQTARSADCCLVLSWKKNKSPEIITLGTLKYFSYTIFLLLPSDFFLCVLHSETDWLKQFKWIALITAVQQTQSMCSTCHSKCVLVMCHDTYFNINILHKISDVCVCSFLSWCFTLPFIYQEGMQY